MLNVILSMDTKGVSHIYKLLTGRNSSITEKACYKWNEKLTSKVEVLSVKKSFSQRKMFDDVYLRYIQFRTLHRLDLISGINPNPEYLTWWALSDKYPEYINVCETMARLVCHASLLRMDDMRLKKLTIFTRSCPLCELSAPDDVRHLVLQCPSSERKRGDMFSHLENCATSLEARIGEVQEEILPLLLGKRRTGFSFEQMEEFWIVAGTYIHEMYRENLMFKRGIG